MTNINYEATFPSVKFVRMEKPLNSDITQWATVFILDKIISIGSEETRHAQGLLEIKND